MTSMFIRNILTWTILGLVTRVLSVPPLPTWPSVYKSCVNMQSPREFIKAGWYVDQEARHMRLDSYGIPKGLNESTAVLWQQYVNEIEDFNYACPQYGPPLYIFIYLYDVGKMLNLFPSAEPPYRSCTVVSIYNTFPKSPLFPDLEFIEEAHDNFTTYNHWRSEFFLFTLDYYFHASNDLPYKLIVQEEENVFISFEEGNLDKGTFVPPAGVMCK